MENVNALEKERELLTETILGAHGFTPDQIGTPQIFEKKKAGIREILELCSPEDEDLNRQMGTLKLILDNKQILKFYLMDQGGRLSLPMECDPDDPDTYETLMLFDELAGALEEIARISMQKKSETQLDESLLRLLGMLNQAPYEKLTVVLNCLLRITVI